MAKVSQRQIVAKVEPTKKGQPSWSTPERPWFSQVSGGEIQASVEKVYDGGARHPEVLCGPSEVGDITVTRHYDPQSDGGKLAFYRQRVGQARFNLSIFTTNCELKVPGYSRVYPNALLVNITEPDGDASSGAPSTFSLTFACGKVTSGPEVGAN